MFRLFLKKKIIDGENTRADGNGEAAKVRAQAQSALAKNRRVFSRYNVDHKHLTLMNEQDILLVREISARGFSTDVSQRGFDRLFIGDVYEARVRYHRETYDLRARVAWKADGVVGFEMVETPHETLGFIKRLLKPIEIAQSMQPVDPSFLREGEHEKAWYHGDQESDLYIWKEQDSSSVKAWQLSIGNQYVEWSELQGLVTGTTTTAPVSDVLSHPMTQMQQPDQLIDGSKKQMAIDIIMALQDPVKDLILETFGE
jgi:hypothetical protein